jgi:hypothetical protein
LFGRTGRRRLRVEPLGEGTVWEDGGPVDRGRGDDGAGWDVDAREVGWTAR